MRLAQKKIKEIVDKDDIPMIKVNGRDLNTECWSVMMSIHMVDGIGPNGKPRTGTLLFIDSVSPERLLKVNKDILDDYE